MVVLQEARRVTLIWYRASANRNIQVVAKWKISNKFERIATLFNSNAPQLNRWVYLKDFKKSILLQIDKLWKKYPLALSSNCFNNREGFKLQNPLSMTCSLSHNGHVSVTKFSLSFVIRSIHSLQKECSHVSVQGFDNISWHTAHSNRSWKSIELEDPSLNACSVEDVLLLSNKTRKKYWNNSFWICPFQKCQ